MSRANPAHYPNSNSLSLSDIKRALAYRTSDEPGMNAEENKVQVPDLDATTLYSLGLDQEKLTYRYIGRDFRLTDVVYEIIA